MIGRTMRTAWRYAVCFFSLSHRWRPINYNGDAVCTACGLIWGGDDFSPSGPADAEDDVLSPPAGGGG
jgi:hypothetical protein